MEMIYNSRKYCVVQIDGREGRAGGFEIVHKSTRREAYLGGEMARRFEDSVSDLIATEPSTDEIDRFLSRFDGLMQQPLVLH